LRDASVQLGVTQRVVETEYYFVDLPAVIDEYRKQNARERLEALQVQAAANGRLEKDEHKRFVAALTKQAGYKANDRFDRNKFEQLRAMTKGGG
jgi:polyhydroxyalkanoate synthesis regulator phasin